jgi:DNA-binding GntR family transcriptional regulator
MTDRDGSAGPPTRTDWAEQILRGEILTGRLRPGARLKIGELVARYEGLSPTPVREALSRLAGAGLVEFLPQRGVRVTEGSRRTSSTSTTTGSCSSPRPCARRWSMLMRR